MWKSDEIKVVRKQANKTRQRVAEPVERRVSAEGNSSNDPMVGTQRPIELESGLERVRAVAREDKDKRFTSLFHHLSMDLLWRGYDALKKKTAAGVDGLDWLAYGENLLPRLTDLHERLQSGRYRSQPVRRVWLDKPDGSKRPLGIACVEDKVVQQAIVWLLETIFDEEFLGFNYGFRPRRSPHNALDQWAHQWRKRYTRGDVCIVRYADDFVCCFQYKSDACAFRRSLCDRLKRFNLTLHREITRLIEFGRFALRNRKDRGEGKPETFDFLGFTHICSKRWNDGDYRVHRVTIAKRLRAKVKEVRVWLKRNRCFPVEKQGKRLASIMRGALNYYSVPGNYIAMAALRAEINKSWYWALRHRSQKATKLTWKTMQRILLKYVPFVRVIHPYPNERLHVWPDAGAGCISSACPAPLDQNSRPFTGYRGSKVWRRGLECS